MTVHNRGPSPLHLRRHATLGYLALVAAAALIIVIAAGVFNPPKPTAGNAGPHGELTSPHRN
jgi:hypothetical protein